MKLENRIEIFYIPNRVTCELCGGRFRSITESHLQKHELHLKEYRKMFPNSHVFCAESRKKLSKKTSEWLKKHPGHVPESHLKELRKNKDFMDKSQFYNALVQRLSYRKKEVSKQFKGFKHNKESVNKRIKKYKENWNNPEFRKTHTGESHNNYGKKRTEQQRKNISNGRKKYWESIKGTEKENQIKKCLKEGQQKSYRKNPERYKKFLEISEYGREQKLKKQREFKSKTMPKIIKLHKEGLSFKEIAKIIEIPVSRIYYWNMKKPNNKLKGE